MRKSLLNSAGLVVNVIITDDEDYVPYDDSLVVGPPGGEIGDTWNGTVYVKNIPEMPPIPITSVTPYQARVALHNAGLLTSVESLMVAETTPTEAKLAWEYATAFYRESTFIMSLAPLLGLTQQQVDDLFEAASQVI